MTARRWRSARGYGQGPDSIVKNAASSFIAQLTTASLTAALTVFLVRELGPKQYGLFALGIGFGTITVSLSDMGITFSTARFVAEHRGREEDLRSLIIQALKLKVIVTGLACALLAALASVIAGVYGNTELVWPLRAMALATFGQSTYLMMLGVSTARGRAAANVRLVAAESMLEIFASVALVLAGTGAAGAAFGRAIGYVLGAAIAAVTVLRLSGKGPVRWWSLPERAIVRRIGGYARSVFAIDASYTTSASLSVILLGALVNSAASGIYQAPLKLITLIQYVGLSTANGVGPRITRGREQGPDVRAMNRALRGLIGFQCLMLAPVVVWARPIVDVVLGHGYGRSADVLRALAPYLFFSGLAPLVTGSVNYLGEARRRIPIAVATLIIVAVGGVILIPIDGVVGAAIATDIAFGFYTLAHIWLCRRLLQLRIRMLLWSLACGLTAAAAMGIVLDLFGTTDLTAGRWIGGGGLGLFCFVGMLVFTREIRGEDIARARAGAATFAARLEPGMWRDRVLTSAVVTGADRWRDRSPAAQPPAWLAELPGEPRVGVRVVAASPAGTPPRGTASAGRASTPARGADAVSSVTKPARARKAGSRVADGPSRSARQPSRADDAAHPSEPAPRTTGSAGTPRRSRPAPSRQRQVRAPAAGDVDLHGLYQIAWQYELCAFELLPLEEPASNGGGAHASVARRSASIDWQWRIPPAPTPEAKRAHAALVGKLVGAGWQHAGAGNGWFAQRFRSPEAVTPATTRAPSAPARR